MKKLLRLLLTTATLASAALAAEPTNNDDAVIREFTTRVKEIQKRALATDDLDERAKAQREVKQLFDDMLPKLSPEARPMMLVSIKVVTPLMERSGAYLAEASKFFSSGGDAATGIASREQIAGRIEKIAHLRKMNTELLATMNRLDADVAAVLDEAKVTGANRTAFLTGFNESMGRTIGPMRAIRTLDTEILTRLVAMFQLLDKYWGKWSANADGTVQWQDETAEKEFTKLKEEIEALADRQAAAEQQLSERL